MGFGNKLAKALGGDGDDKIKGPENPPEIYGNENEVFNGNAGNDEIHGGDHATTQALDGGAGDDSMKGGDNV